MDCNTCRNSQSHVTDTLSNSCFPFRFWRSIIRLSGVYTVPQPCRFACTVPPPCNERLLTAQRRPGAGPKHKHKKLASSCRDTTRFKQDGILQIPKSTDPSRTGWANGADATQASPSVSFSAVLEFRWRPCTFGTPPARVSSCEECVAMKSLAFPISISRG